MRLFKYLHPDRMDVLRGGTIRFSSPRVLNDPFELKPHVSALAPQEEIHSEFERVMPEIVAKEYATLPAQFRATVPLNLFQMLAKTQFPKAMAHLQGLAEMAAPMAQRMISRNFEEMIGILCLTESPANLLMWAHYADSHQGFVVEFDSECPFFDQRKGPEDDLRHLRKVLYSERRPSLMLSEIEDFSPFLTKGLDWSYETEWRMMFPLSAAFRVIGDGPTAIHLFEYPRSAIRSVILGCRVTEVKLAEIRQILKDIDELKHVQCMKTQIDEAHYRLGFTKIAG